MFRLYILTFEGKSRFDEHHVHPHESSKVMTIPLMILAFLSIVGGFVGLPKVFAGEHGNALENWLEPVFKPAHFKLMSYAEHSGAMEVLLMVVSVIGASAAILLAYYMYAKKTSLPDKVSAKFHGLYKILFNKYYVDEIYNAAVVQPIYNVSEKFLWKFTDVKIIDGLINGTASLVERCSVVFKKLQTGFTQFYAVIMVAGIALALLWLMRLM
jgi:NADH-quinone oxidoreductase subunit L